MEITINDVREYKAGLVEVIAEYRTKLAEAEILLRECDNLLSGKQRLKLLESKACEAR